MRVARVARKIVAPSDTFRNKYEQHSATALHASDDACGFSDLRILTYGLRQVHS